MNLEIIRKSLENLSKKRDKERVSERDREREEEHLVVTSSQ